MQTEKFETKIILKTFFILFLMCFLIFNWGKISWIFNFKAISITISNFFSEKNPSQSSQISQIESLQKEEFQEKFEFTEKENSLEIPRIEISAPFFLVESKKENEISKILEKGLVLLSDYSLPGENGRTVILGHSARHDWPKSNPVWVFTYLRDVKEQDEIILNFNYKKYKYYVEKIFVLKEGEELPLVENENVLFLITCWPPGRLVFKERLIVQAKLN